jgi:sugar lactone lactonase YvrE
MSGRKIFSQLDESKYGWPDGLCIDDQGGIWSSRWQGGKLIRLTSDGQIDVIIEFPKACNITCSIFGGPNLDELYVTSASATCSGDSVDENPQGGDLFVIKNLGFRGQERNRFVG